MKALPVHEALAPLSWIIGTWRCEKVLGFYPTIKDYEYGEELRFVSFGQPMLSFASFSWCAEKKTPIHLESGFLKVVPETNKVSLLLGLNNGGIAQKLVTYKCKCNKAPNLMCSRINHC